MRTLTIAALISVLLSGCVRDPPTENATAPTKISGSLIFSEGYRDGGSIGFITIDDYQNIYKYFIHLPRGNYNGIYYGYSVPTNLAHRLNDDIRLLNEIIDLTKKDCALDVLERVYQIDQMVSNKDAKIFEENDKWIKTLTSYQRYAGYLYSRAKWCLELLNKKSANQSLNGGT